MWNKKESLSEVDMKLVKSSNSAITVTRILAMLLIILCHIISYYEFIPGYQFLNVIFNVGVYVFLIISGYLYGNKDVKCFCVWMIKRIQRIYIPFLVVVIPVIFVSSICNIKYSLLTRMVYLLNLQGFLFIDWTFFSSVFDEITNLGHLWFTTVIIICYLLIPFLQKIKNKVLNKVISLIFLCVALFLSYILIVLTNITLTYFIAFIFGYYFGTYKFFEELNIKTYSIISVLMFLFTIGRFFLMKLFDETIYYSAFVTISQFALALWVVASVFYIRKMFEKSFDKFTSKKSVIFFDKISYYIYLTHYIFARGQFNVYEMFNNILLSTIVFIFLIFISALVVMYISNLINSQIDRIVENVYSV